MFNDPWALLRRDICTRLRHCRADSLVTVCDAALKGIADQSRGVLTEMRVARDHHTISCTPHHSFARAEQEDAGLATFSRMSSAMAVSNAFSRAMKSHTSVLHGNIDPLPGQAKSCSASPITRATVSVYFSAVTPELLCTTAALRP